MKRAWFEWYQYLAPAVLTPLSFYLWWRCYEGNLWLTLIAWLIPIIYAYIVPGIGTNVLKVWEINTKIRMGRFRPHHGFVFGSATAMIAWLCHSQVTDAWGMLRSGFVMASVLGFWNLLYDIKGLDADILRVYNQPWADGKGSEAIAMDYAPWFFAGFGLMYGLGLGGVEWLAASKKLDGASFAILFPLTLVLTIAFPVLGYIRRSWRVHGHSGCHPVNKDVQ